MRNMSFSLTTPQFVAGTKDVTRRMGWKNLKPGDLVQAVEKGMGLKKGEKVKKLAVIRVISARREKLCYMDEEDVAREGFPTWDTVDFVKMFMRANSCSADEIITRIEFEKISL